MKSVESAVTAYLQAATSVPAVAERSLAAGVYPLLAVSVREGGTVLVDGGRQAEHTYHATVTAASDRHREGAGALLSGLIPALLRGIPMGEGGARRVLHPLNSQTEGDALTFDVELCVPLPEMGKSGGEIGTMRTLKLGI